MPEVEIERAEDEAEEGDDTDDLRDDDREHLIKGNRSKVNEVQLAGLSIFLNIRPCHTLSLLKTISLTKTLLV